MEGKEASSGEGGKRRADVASERTRVGSRALEDASHTHTFSDLRSNPTVPYAVIPASSQYVPFPFYLCNVKFVFSTCNLRREVG